jgi:hypothetical protein
MIINRVIIKGQEVECNCISYSELTEEQKASVHFGMLIEIEGA